MLPYAMSALLYGISMSIAKMLFALLVLFWIWFFANMMLFMTTLPPLYCIFSLFLILGSAAYDVMMLMPSSSNVDPWFMEFIQRLRVIKNKRFHYHGKEYYVSCYLNSDELHITYRDGVIEKYGEYFWPSLSNDCYPRDEGICATSCGLLGAFSSERDVYFILSHVHESRWASLYKNHFDE